MLSYFPKSKNKNGFHTLIFSIYENQVIVLIKSKIYKPLAPKAKKKPPQNISVYFFKLNV